MTGSIGSKFASLWAIIAYFGGLDMEALLFGLRKEKLWLGCLLFVVMGKNPVRRWGGRQKKGRHKC